MSYVFDILINGRIHGQRSWPHVPRIGEMVWVQKGSNPDLEEDAYCLVRMVWWRQRGASICQLECEPPPGPTALQGAATGRR